MDLRGDKLMAVFWSGSDKCDICKADLHNVLSFYDSKMKSRSAWALMCDDCYKEHGIGKLGTGLGQRYDGLTFRRLGG